MAINWKIRNNRRRQERLNKKEQKKRERNIPFLGIGVFFLTLFFSLLIFEYQIYKDNFKTVSIFDMANGKYREDANYVDTCVGLFHDLVADTLYREGHFFDTRKNGGDNSVDIYDRVAELRSVRGLYTYVNQGKYDSCLRLYMQNQQSDNPVSNRVFATFLPGNVELTFYNNGNAYSGSKINFYRIMEYNTLGVVNKPGRLGIMFYDNAGQNFMIIGSNRVMSGPAYGAHGSQSIKYGVISNGTLYHYSSTGITESVSQKNTFVFKELNKFGVRKDKENRIDTNTDYLYTVSDKDGNYTAEVDVSVGLGIDSGATAIKKISEREETGNTLTFKEVWNSIFALAEYVPEKTPLLFMSYDDNMGFLLKGNQSYVERYKELYGEEYVEKFDSDNAQIVNAKRYSKKRTMYSLYPHTSRTVQSIISEDKKIVALFADQNFHLQYKESPLYSYEMAAVAIRYSTMLIPVVFLLSVSFLVIGIYKKQQKTEQSVHVLAMGFLPVEIRGFVLFALCLSLIYCYTMLYRKNFYGYISPFFLLMLIIFVGSTVYWWRLDRGSVFSNSWIIRLADYISERNRVFYQSHGMSFFLSRRSTQFACGELILGVLILVAVICKYTMETPVFSLPFFGGDIKVSLWTFLILFLFIAVILVLISYLRFLSVFTKGLNGVQHQLDLMGEGDFETVVPLPKNFYGFQVEEQFEAIKNGMLNAMEGEMRSERMKIDLVANVSHDIKTPLTSIINYVDLLADSKDLPAAEADYVQVLQRKSYRLRSMIQDLFDLSKATSGNLLVEFAELNFTKLIQQTMADMQEEIEASKLQFRCNLLEQVYIMSDGNRLYQVLQNLINNAINYSMEQSRVYLNLDVVDDHAVFSIKNMSRDEMNFTREQVLERFFRGDQARSSEGSGLGVAIANSFVEVCGGEFDISIDADLFCATIQFPVVMPLKKIGDMDEQG